MFELLESRESSSYEYHHFLLRLVFFVCYILGLRLGFVPHSLSSRFMKGFRG